MASTAAAFPTTQPALRMKVELTGIHKVGTVHSGADLTIATFGNGTLESLPDFEPQVKMTIPTGSDWLYVDHAKNFARSNVRGVAVDDEGVTISMSATAVTALNAELGALLAGDPKAKSMSFAQTVETLHFEAGHEKYKFLEQSTWVVSMRFTVDGSTAGAEMAIARLLSGSGTL